MKGSCLCGNVCFEVKGDFESFYLCHCSHCRKGTGSAHGANLFSTTANLRWISGEAKVKRYNLPNTRHVKSFCSECGSAMPNQQGALLVVPAGCLDDEVRLKPNAHIFMASRASWDHELETLAKIDRLPSME